MAKKVTVSLIDDLDGSPAVQTVEFALDGKTYEIDLSAVNAGKLRSVLTDYAEAGRRAGASANGRPAARRTGGTNMTATRRQETQAIREWARQNNIDISDRGRIPVDVEEQYHAAQKAARKAG